MPRPFTLKVYWSTAGVSFVALLLSILALTRVDWIKVPASDLLPASSYGLFQRCDRISDLDPTSRKKVWRCRRFPKRRLDCARVSTPLQARFSALMGIRDPHDDYLEPERFTTKAMDGPLFCNLWISAGYASELSIPFAAVASIASVAYTLPQIRTKQRKKHGWKVVAVLTGLHAIMQIVATSLIAHLYRTSGRFPDGSTLNVSWIVAAVSYAVSVSIIFSLVFAEMFGLARSHKRSMSLPPNERQPLLQDSSQ